MQNKGSELPKEHILVCLSSSPSNERIVRMAGKMAQAFSGSLTALYVQTPGDADMNAEDTVRLQANMRLAQQFGAEIITTHGEDVATQIAEYARLSDVTKIVIGRSGVQRRHFWSHPTLTERLIELAPGLDIHIIPDADIYKNYRQKSAVISHPTVPTIGELLLTLGILGMATAIGWGFSRLGFTDANIIAVYLLSVLLTSLFTSGYVCGILASFLSVILFNYFLTEPRLSLLSYDSGYPVTFVIMLGIALLTGTLAAKLSPVTLGSDTGGSIRQPCSFCGVTGLKPTYGAVSRYGLVAYASSLDQIGPIGKDVDDCAALFSVIQGKDEKDGTSMVYDKFDFDKAVSGEIKGKKIGIPEDYLGEGINEDVKASILAAADKFRELGAEVEMFKMPIAKYAIPTYYIIACAEACSNLSRYDGIKYGYSSKNSENLLDRYVMSRSEGFGMEVKRRIMLGNFVLSSGYYDAYYNKALKAKKLIQNAFFDAFEKFDMILGPVAPTTALKMGESLSDPLKMYLGDIYTVMINIAGLPSFSAPCGFDADGMPIGMQLIGKPFCEAEIMSAAKAFQNATDYHTKLPTLD